MRKNKNTSKIVLALSVAVLATIISYSVFSHMQTQLNEQNKVIENMQNNQGANLATDYTYAIATTDIKAGEMVTDGEVDFKAFPAENVSAFDNRNDVVNKVLLKDIKAGEIFTSSYIAKISGDEDLSLRNGYRALTLPADSFQGKSASMHAGSVVDIYNAPTDGSSSWHLENVRIIALESNGKNDTTTNTQVKQTSMTDASAITFEVSARNISDFITHVSQGKLVLVSGNQNTKLLAQHSSGNSYGNEISSGYTPKRKHRRSGYGNLSGIPS